MMDNGINIEGAKVDKDSLAAIADAICRILQQDVEQKTKRAALKALQRMMPSANVTVQGCQIDGSTHVHEVMDTETVMDTEPKTGEPRAEASQDSSSLL